MTGNAEPVVVLPHLLGAQPSLADQQLELLLSEGRDHGHGAGPPPHPVQVQRGIIAHPLRFDLFPPLNLKISFRSAGVFFISFLQYTLVNLTRVSHS